MTHVPEIGAQEMESIFLFVCHKPNIYILTGIFS